MTQKYFYRSLLILTLFWPCLLSCSAAQAPTDNAFPGPEPPPRLGANLVKNAGFEAGASDWSLHTATVVSGEAHSGNHSLQYHNSNPRNYQLLTQDIPAAPGQIIHFSAWLKGDTITPESLYQEKGAGIFLQSYDKDGNYISGAFPFTLPGTFDWKQSEGIYPVPQNAARVSLGLYLRRGSTGTVWFDDITAQMETPRRYEAFLQYPNYRGLTTTDNSRPWKILLRNQLPSSISSQQVQSEICDAAGKVLFRENATVLPGKELLLQWKPPHPLAVGEYQWKLLLPDTGSGASKVLFRIRVQNAMPPTYIDAEGFTVVNGTRFFPLGLYLGKLPQGDDWGTTDENMQRIANAGFNTLLNYVYGGRNKTGQQYLATAERHHLKVIYSLTDTYDGVVMNPNIAEPGIKVAARVIQQLKDQPALLAWYTNDEQGYGELPGSRALYQLIQNRDNSHPVFQVQNKPALLSWDYYGSDVLGTDPYPASNAASNLQAVTNSTRAALQASEHSKAVWQALQIHDKSFHKGKGIPPSLAQMRNMSYQALIAGAKGMMFYAYHWLWMAHDATGKRISSKAAFEKRWPDVQKLAREMNTLVPVILQDHNVAIPSAAPAHCPYRAWQNGDALYILIANPAAQRDALRLQIPDSWKNARSLNPGITVQATGNSLDIHLDPIASGVVLLQRKTAP